MSQLGKARDNKLAKNVRIQIDKMKLADTVLTNKICIEVLTNMNYDNLTPDDILDVCHKIILILDLKKPSL